MDFKKLQTNIKDNKRQIMEQVGYFDEKILGIESNIDKLNADVESLNTNIDTLNSNIVEKINYISLLPINSRVDIGITLSTPTDTDFIAPFNGYCFVSIQNGTAEGNYTLANQSAGELAIGINVPTWKNFLVYVPCKKGDTIRYRRTVDPVNIWLAKFIKAGSV